MDLDTQDVWAEDPIHVENRARLIREIKASFNTVSPSIAETIPGFLKDAKRWLLWRYELPASPKYSHTTKPAKIPYYISGSRRTAPDSPADASSLATFHDALQALQAEEKSFTAYSGLGFALGKDGDLHWQGIDLDKVSQRPHLAALQLPGYVETTPSGDGYHAIGYGEAFPAIKATDGIEAYSTGRYFTVTGRAISSEQTDIKPFVEQLRAAPVQKKEVYTQDIDTTLTHTQLEHLASALTTISADDYHTWVDIGLSLKKHGLQGLELWLAWSASSPKFEQYSALQKWDTFPSVTINNLDYRRIFTLAQAYGWRNPLSKDKPIEPITSHDTLPVTFASDLPEAYSPPDELVENLIVNKTTTILYGSSNSGKTFFALDLCCAISLNKEWMGRKVDGGGLTVYLATESPETVTSRIQAYQQYHNTRIDSLAIIPVPLNFHESDEDAAAVIRTVRHLEQTTELKTQLIIGDTLARMAAGADENSPKDMTPVMRRFDALVEALNTAVVIIHHSGKDEARGARGTSAIRAHVDTEIEIAERDGYRVATVTKQRALSGKGDEIAFNLKVVPLGQNKWGLPASTCIVEPVNIIRAKANAAEQKEAENLKLNAEADLQMKYEITRVLRTSGPLPKTLLKERVLGRNDRKVSVIAELLTSGYLLSEVSGSGRSVSTVISLADPFSPASATEERERAEGFTFDETDNVPRAEAPPEAVTGSTLGENSVNSEKDFDDLWTF